MRSLASVSDGYHSNTDAKIWDQMKIYIITKNSTKRAYLSFNRLLKEESIEEYCKRFLDAVPAKNNLPASLALGQIIINTMEVDERV